MQYYNSTIVTNNYIPPFSNPTAFFMQYNFDFVVKVKCYLFLFNLLERNLKVNEGSGRQKLNNAHPFLFYRKKSERPKNNSSFLDFDFNFYFYSFLIIVRAFSYQSANVEGRYSNTRFPWVPHIESVRERRDWWPPLFEKKKRLMAAVMTR